MLFACHIRSLFQNDGIKVVSLRQEMVFCSHSKNLVFTLAYSTSFHCTVPSPSPAAPPAPTPHPLLLNCALALRRTF